MFLPAVALCSVGSGGQLSRELVLGVVGGGGGGRPPHLKHCPVTTQPAWNVKQTRRGKEGGGGGRIYLL